MNFQLSRAVWEHSGQKKSGALVVLLAIADYANDDGVAWPAVQTLARKVRMSKRNVQRWLKALQQDRELEIFPNKGRHGSNLYRICLPVPKRGRGGIHVGSDISATTHVTPASSTNDAGVTQSINKSSICNTPIVPTGDDIDFWINVCFKCFGQAVHPIRAHVLRVLRRILPALKKDYGKSLVEFYRDEAVDAKEPPYNSRRHSPERLILDLPRQLALAVQACPPPTPPKKHDFTIEDVNEYLTERYPGCNLPSSLEDLDTPWWQYMKEEIHEAMRERKGNHRRDVDAT